MSSNTTAGFRLSPQQERLWTLAGAEGTGFRAQCALRLDGALDAEQLQRALASLVARYEILRTTFPRQAGLKVPFQVILETSEPAWTFIDLSGSGKDEKFSVTELLSTERSRALNLEQGPVLRAVLCQFSTTCRVLVLTLPSGCADARSLQNLVTDLGRAYATAPGAPVPDEDILQYADVVEWQYELLEGEDTKAGRDFWRDHVRTLDLKAAATASLPLERQTSGCFTFAEHTVELGTALSEKSVTVAKALNVPTPDLLLAAWSCLLSRLTSLPCATLACSFDGRKHEELQNALGLFARSLPLNARVDNDSTFAQVLRQSSISQAEAGKWQDAFSWTHMDASTGPDTLALPFAYEYVALPEPSQVGDLTWAIDSVRAVWEPFALKLVCLQRVGSQNAGSQNAASLRCEFQYDARRFAADDVARWAEHFQVLLAAALDAPETPVRRLPLITGAQRQQLLSGWNPASSAIPALCFHQLFEQQAARTPDRIAVVCDGVSLTYAQFNARANQLAQHLRSLGVGPDSRVGLCLDRSVSLMTGLLAILKAGGAYVPLQSDHPPARLAQQLDGAAALLTEEKLLTALPSFPGPVLALDRDATTWASQPTSNPPLNTEPNHLAYVIFTSGSTGVPKGVAISHRNLVNYTTALTGVLHLADFPDGLRFATVSALNADLGNTCIFPALASGGTLHVLPYDVSTDARRFAQYSAEHRIDVLKIVPSHLQALLSADQAANVLPRQFLITGGESLTRPLVESILALSPKCQLINHYGPTETTIGSLTLPLRDYDWQHSRAATIPIGRPLPNTRVYVLDADLEPVPVGVPGELFIAGAGVARGYLQQPERTAERFLADPFGPNQESTKPEARMYRTGDLARWLPEGLIEFLGRADDQVKVRGFRIELGEVEAALVEHALVRQAAVLARQDSQNGAPGEKRLVAYIVPTPGSQLSPDTLRMHLKTLLPDYMIPAALVLLDKLPLTPNGKIDRQKLPAPEALAQSKPFVAPTTPTELALAQIWQEVLRKDKISADDNFFDLGGHSLLATQVVSRVREQLKLEMALRSIFETPTIAGLAATLADSPATTSAETPTITRVSREAYRVTRG